VNARKPVSEREREREREHTYSLESASKTIYLQIPDWTMTFQQEEGPNGFQAWGKMYFESRVFAVFVSVHILDEL